MRKIKFRGFDLDVKRWFYGSYHKHIKRQVCPMNDSLKDTDIQHIIVFDGFADWNMEIPLKIANNIDINSVGEFTGLHDKQGKEIYEGDIVILNFTYGTFKCVIEYKDCHFEVSDLKNDSLRWFLHPSFELEIIGNIYENPEMLLNK